MEIKEPKITIFAENINQINYIFENYGNLTKINNIIDNNNISENLDFISFIIEDIAFSRLCLMDFNETVPNYTRLTELIDTIKKYNPQAEIIFNMDIIPHNEDFRNFNMLFDFLIENNINIVRVCDAGVINFILKNYPNIYIQLNTETGNNNEISIKFWKEKLNNRLDKIILSKELDYTQINEILTNIPNLKTELQIHGLVLLLYSKRKIIEGISFLEDNKNHKLELIDKLNKNKIFTLIYNKNGTFLLHKDLLCLFEEMPIIIDLGIDSLLIDLRYLDNKIILSTIEIYKKLIDALIKSNVNNLDLTEIKNKIPNGNKNFFKGFFLENNTDKKSTKKVTYTITKNNNYKDNENYIGEIIDIVKEKIVTIKIKNPISINQTIIIDTPEGKIIPLTITTIKDLMDNNLDFTQKNGIYKINWKKGLVIGSYLYKG